MNANALRAAVAVQLLLAAGLARLLVRRGWSPARAVAAAAAALPAGYLLVIGQHFVTAHLADDAPAVDAQRRADAPAGPVPPCAVPSRAAQRPGSDARPGAWRTARLVLVEALDAMRAFGWLQPFREGAPLAAPRRAERIPVLLLHGYLCNRGLWRPFARHLADHGHPVDAITLHPPFGSIDAYADPVAAAVERLRARTGAARVAVIGHSMGGLALRAYLRRHGTGAVTAAVTLGTPHAGTRLARLGYGRNARQMRFESDWLRRLAADEPQAARQLLTVVLTLDDNIVSPRAAQTLAGSDTVELRGIGHLSLAFDRKVMRTVSQRLADLDGWQADLPGAPGAPARRAA